MRLVQWGMGKLGGRTPDEGAYMYLHGAAVADGRETHGSFLMNWEIAP